MSRVDASDTVRRSGRAEGRILALAAISLVDADGAAVGQVIAEQLAKALGTEVRAAQARLRSQGLATKQVALFTDACVQAFRETFAGYRAGLLARPPNLRN